MLSVRKSSLPDVALLAAYAGDEGYTDCYVTEISATVTHGDYIEAFYTTWLFKLERVILRFLVSRPSTDQQARDLASGKAQEFAAWSVEKRAENQLLMCDFQRRTRSWLMVEAVTAKGGTVTHLYFGSAIVFDKDPTSGNSAMPFAYRAVLVFHKIYSVLLLYFAKSRLNAAAG